MARSITVGARWRALDRYIRTMYRFDVTSRMHEAATCCQPPGHPGPSAPAQRRVGPVPSGAVTFRPESIRGAGPVGATATVDYRLARLGVVSEYRKGRLARHEVCDAHPELRRAAAEASEPTSMECPIC